MNISILKTFFALGWGLAVFAPAVSAAGTQEQVFAEIADAVSNHYCDAAFIREYFPALRRKYEPEAAAADPAQFAAVVNTMLAELGSSHTHYYTPEDAAYYQLISIFREHPTIRDAFDGHPPAGPEIRLGIFRKASRAVQGAERPPRAVVHAGAEDPAQLPGGVPAVVQRSLVAEQGCVDHAAQRCAGVLGQ